MLARVFVLCMAGGAAAAAAPSCSGAAEEVDEVQLLQKVVRAHGPAHSAAENAFPKTMSYIAKEMSHKLAAALPDAEVMEVLQAMLANAKASSPGSTKEMDDRALRLFKDLDRLASKPASVHQPAQQGGGLPYDPHGHTESVESDAQFINCTQPPQDGNCAWYAECLELDRNCNEGGYPLGFASATCIAVDEDELLTEQNSSAALAWWHATTACLQRSLVADMANQTTCDDLWGSTESGKESHAFLYQKRCFSGTQTCSLGLRDVLRIMAALSCAYSSADLGPDVVDFADKTYDELFDIFLECQV